ncbi:hypothetical protein BU17DRAFT_43029 [Hysterangium stoloniferum]|nr:hypothetical protein BU17DRAFT_43029 [Hysterangium stoloniferum]
MTLTATIPRYAPWSAKKQLTPAQYTSLTVAVSKVLNQKVAVVDTKFDIEWAKTFICSLVQDNAYHILQSLNSVATQEPNVSTYEKLIHQYTLKLAERLAKIRNGLDIASLVDLAVVYGSSHVVSVRNIFTDACNSTPSLLDHFKNQAIPAFNANLKKIQSVPLEMARKTTYILSQILLCGSPLVILFVSSTEFIQTLSKCYHVDMETPSNSQGGPTAEAQKDILHIKTSLLDSLHAIVKTLLNNADNDALFDMLFAFLELLSSSSDNTIKTPFVSQSLLADYQYAFGLSNMLTEKFASLDDARVDLLSATLADLSPVSAGSKDAKGLAPLLKDHVPRRKDMSVPAQSSDIKGKGKAVRQSNSHLDFRPFKEEDGSHLDLAVSQVLDIFPNYTPRHIRRCLEDRRFGGNAEMLISALLEGTLPPELERAEETPSEAIQPVDEFKYTRDRRNVFDDVPMDLSRLKIGKTNSHADSLLQDRSFIEQMKADIIRRAEEIANDGDEEYEISAETSRQPRVIFEDDLDEVNNKGVRVIGDGEDSDGGESDDNTALSTANIPSPETILELKYLEDPKYFDRDSKTRRSTARADLKARTGGWGDEQIEGWKIMLERNPNKDKILQKHEFAGNKPFDRQVMHEAGPSGGDQGRSGDARGRGKGRGGRGGGGGGTGDTSRDRAWKDKNKARNANHNRKRGHDKKLARGGAPVV